MGAKHDYIQQQITAVRSQLEAKRVAIGKTLSALKGAEARNTFREQGGEDPVRAATAAQFDGLKALVDGVNAGAVGLPSKADFLAGFDAATDE